MSLSENTNAYTHSKTHGVDVASKLCLHVAEREGDRERESCVCVRQQQWF